MSKAPSIALWQGGAGPRLILLHGWTMTGAVMAPLSQLLCNDFSVLVPDLPAHGATSGYAPTLEGGDQILADLLADGQPTVLVGWSLGALLAWRMAHLPNVLGIVSLDMSPYALPNADWPFGLSGQSEGSLMARAQKLCANWAAIAPSIAASLFRHAEAHPDHGAIAAIVAAQDPEAMATFWSSLLLADCRASLREMRCPLLAIHGAESSVYPAAVLGWLSQNVRQVQTHLLDGVGHAPHLEAPMETAALIGAFAKEVFAR